MLMEVKKCHYYLLESLQILDVLMVRIHLNWKSNIQAARERGWIFYFSAWLKKFDMYVSKTPNRKVALLLDNASAHGQIEDLHALLNVEVIFLTKNTTAFLQILDAGVIASLKKRYRKKKYERALCLIENENTKDLYNVNVLEVMESLWNNWNEIDQKIIYNCWRKTGIIDSSTITNLQEEEDDDETFNVEGGDDCVGSIADSKIVQIGLGQ